MTRPNVLIVFADQLRRYSAGYWSQAPYRDHVIGEPDPVVTPNLDKLAASGVVFTNAISNSPVCSPHRGMLLTGMYPEKNGLITNCHKSKTVALKKDVTAITDVFHGAGYNTAYFGKCHWVRTEPLFDKDGKYVGKTEAPGGHLINGYDTYVPPGVDRHNIEYFYQTIRDAHCNPLVYSSDPGANDGKADGVPTEPKQFSTKLESNALLSYLKNERKQRDGKKPFFAIWSINPPHAGWGDSHVETKYRDKYYGKDKFPKTTDLLVRKNLIPNAEKEAKHARNYFAAVTSLDHYVGKVMDQLRTMGVLENTLVIFTSDHGEYLGSHHSHGKNGPYLEAYGVPFIVSWTGQIQPGIDRNMLSVPDILPTTLGLAGLEKAIPAPVQGRNFSALLKDPENAAIQPATDALLSLNPSHRRGIVTTDWVLVVEPKAAKKNPNRLAAYLNDMKKDPYQTRRIPLDQEPEVSKRLLALLAQRLKEIDDSWWQEKKYGDLIPWGEQK